MKIHLGIAFDQNYLSPFFALTSSIFEHNKNNGIIIHAIVTGVKEEVKRKIKEYVYYSGNEICFYNIDEVDVTKYVLTSKWTSAVYYRLYFPFLIPTSVTRLIYLDTDMIVLKDLTELYQTDLMGYPVGAVYDNWVKTAPQLGINEEEEYFNSGMLLMDLKEWRLQKVSERAFDYLARYPDRIKFVDQDALNAVLINNWKKLDIRYNMMYSCIPEGLSKKELQDYIKDKVILHFTLQRPWEFLCKNRLRSLYFKYLNLSPANEQRVITDFEWKKTPQFIRIRLVEMYHDSSLIRRVWRAFKG